MKEFDTVSLGVDMGTIDLECDLKSTGAVGGSWCRRILRLWKYHSSEL